MKLGNIYKLVTHEDIFHIHKILGVFVLSHYAYRFYNVIFNNTTLLDKDENTPLYILAHLLLSGSSLIFKLPKNRVEGKPIIFPEFRAHSILFAYRSLLSTLCFYYKLDIIYNQFILFLTLMGADLITNHYKSETKTMRNMPYDTFLKDEKDKKQISRIYGGMQVSATIMTMGNIHSAFTPAFAIQLAAFLMTLVKKNILSAREWHIIYMLSLFINVHSFMTLEITTILFMTVLINVFEIFRFDYKINKYILWYIICYLYMCLYNGKFDNIANSVNDYCEEVGVDYIKYGLVVLFYLKNIYGSRKLYFDL